MRRADELVKSFCRLRLAGLVAAAALILPVLSVPAWAQAVEIVPVAGYRFGGDFFELATNRPIDRDVAPAIGAILNVAMGDGLWFETLFTRQQTRVTDAGSAFAPSTSWRIRVDHWQAGGLQEFGSGRARPFLSGLLGLTWYAAEGDDEVRFTMGAGGGVKLSLGHRLGARFDSRVFTTFVDADARAVACTPGICLVGLKVDVVWQLEFSAGLVVAF